MKENLIHSRTCVYNINYHVVWSVKYRRKILSAEIEIYLKELVQKIASDKGFMVHLFEVGEGDHIHCFVSYYVETIGSVSEENIRRYIEHQSKSY